MVEILTPSLLWEVRAGMQTDVSNSALECSSLNHWHSTGSTAESVALSVAFNNFSLSVVLFFWQKQCLLIVFFFSNFLLSAAFDTFLQLFNLTFLIWTVSGSKIYSFKNHGTAS